MNLENIISDLNRIVGVRRFLVAYSGGVDSHVLLHLMVKNRSALNTGEIVAVHVHHGLQSAADHWVQHCDSQCDSLGVPLHVCNVEVPINRGESLEANARKARYAALESLMQEGDCFVLAQHADDQVETFLLQALRGSGIKGLAAIPGRKKFGSGYMLRPLLHSTRQQIEAYANENQLEWIEDPSNLDHQFDRNRLRSQVIPLLKERWPSLTDTFSRSARWCAEADELLTESAREDLRRCCVGNNARQLRITELLQLSMVRQKNLLRYWFQLHAEMMPNHRQLQEILHEIIEARQDAQPVLSADDFDIRRYRDQIYWLDKSDLQPCDSVDWNLQSPLRLSDGRTLVAEKTAGYGIRDDINKASVSVRFRQGGERCKPAGGPHHRELKKLFQEWGVPPWERDRIPMIYVGNELAAVVGYFVTQEFSAGATQTGYQVEISPA